jgi:hypothetical protein
MLTLLRRRRPRGGFGAAELELVQERFDNRMTIGHPSAAFCGVLALFRVRVVRVARDETAATTLPMIADCIELRWCTRARSSPIGWVAAPHVVIPTPDCVRFTACYRLTELAMEKSLVSVHI